jgi:hypothetical protein
MTKNYTSPNYRQIYLDIIVEKCPEKINDQNIINKINTLSTILDIVSLNDFIFEKGSLVNESCNQKLRSYDKDSILAILDYQEKNELNNSQLSKHYKLSRNTITKWKRYFK